MHVSGIYDCINKKHLVHDDIIQPIEPTINMNMTLPKMMHIQKPNEGQCRFSLVQGSGRAIVKP